MRKKKKQGLHKHIIKKNHHTYFVPIFYIIAFFISIPWINRQRILLQESGENIAPVPYLVDIFDKEQTIKSPINFSMIQQPRFPNRTCTIIDHGAIADGKTLNTRAFSETIKNCSRQGGGTVEVPAGLWLTGAIKLESNINLHLDKDATILFSQNPQDYLPVVFSRYEGIEYNGFSPFIYATHSSNIAITGDGKLNGQGNAWWPKNKMAATYSLYDMANQGVPVEKRIFNNEQMMLRPSFIQFENCNSILLEDFTITNSPMWTIHPLYSSNIIMRNLNINTPGLNTDGIAIDSSKKILIENSEITSGDDAIVIKSGRDADGLRVNKSSENIVIRNCNIYEGHAGLSFGSETSGDIKSVFAYNNKIRSTTFAIRLKSSIGRGGKIENIWTSNIMTEKTTSDCIQITTDYDDPRTPSDTAEPSFQNIYFDNIKCKNSSGSINILGLKNNPVRNISFVNSDIRAKTGPLISNAENINLSDTSIVDKNGYPLSYKLKNTQKVTILGMSCSQMTNRCTEIQK